MNAHQLAQKAYMTQTQSIRTPRGVEYEVFGRITRRIKTAAGLGRAEFPSLVGALHDNRRFWTMLALDVASPENELPDEIRSRILYLNEFVQTYTSSVLKGRAEPAALIDINTAIMRGLRGQEKTS
ncbi:flagellar biosynthesis regulator FlaF [Mangrovicoccus sp. HB182678]|uniref:Flagellar biosynthesis regulator FlaF n=1 Tax=Mangrovicoccus algicola TaxID=2771008 RepID=A0A8J6Z9X3_9RHOB|nr:flagellar biosynthesis regulator FlaF [Mangrovicoccus algicola]MBE3639050.1 flagellar biosynthesis regulator FlaF [Mangrovicoccus algicola]